MYKNPFEYSASGSFLIGPHCLCVCVFVCCTEEVRFDGLEAKLQALSEFSHVPGASAVQSLHCQAIRNRHSSGKVI